MQTLDRRGLLQRVRSTSYIAALSAAERERAMAPVERLVEQLPEPIELPYRTDLFTFAATA
ncbi:hypothetical protein [Conexibacter woesei]|uniref:hypothetical protein n=1 Tax=Conexibacter woesei TaxID=191495 RepID=UPI000310C593|nr:hypothetical protein [Conexibacter woesei]